MVNEEQVQRLAELMDAEVSCYDDLLDRSREHHAALLSGEPARVESSLRAQIQAVEHCRAASEQRVLVSRDLSQGMGLGEQSSASRLIAHLPPVSIGGQGKLEHREMGKDGHAHEKRDEDDEHVHDWRHIHRCRVHRLRWRGGCRRSAFD